MEELVIKETEQISQASFFKEPSPMPMMSRENEPLFQDRDGNIVIASGISVASYFAGNENYEGVDWKGFKAFIISRLNYLKQLESLGENWASGKSLPPNLITLIIGRQILMLIESWYLNSQLQCNYLPAITLGPIPSGGLAFEITPQADIKLYINLYNNGQIEMELDNSGYFTDIETTKETLFTKITEVFSQYSERGNYSGRRDFI